MVSEKRLRDKLDYWKKQLIDTTKRNPLVYFKPASRSVVKLTEPTLQDIYTRLVDKEEPLKKEPLQFYLPQPDENLPNFDEDTGGKAEDSHLPPLRADEVRSDLADHQLLWRTLYALRQKSRTSLQERGIVTLFLAIGFLEWTETPSSNSIVRSPLILVPVQLDQVPSSDNYQLTLFEDEIVVNPTLIHRLKTTFKLPLPELPEDETLKLDGYFQKVKQTVCDRPKWSVVPEIYLGLFSFHKLSMYKDLENNTDLAFEHPIIRALAGDTSRLPQIPEGLPTAEDLDQVVTPLETFQILDADSSQQEAIQAARHGVSFTLQGPPGTGKSQTIANIIAERLAQKKKVLFVSEKMAALEVVYRRLKNKGLSEFCLQVHSYKANKKDVSQELGKALASPRRIRANDNRDFSEFSSLKERLNSYVSALHTVHEPLNRTAYQAYGELARLLDAPDFQFDFERIEAITPSDLTRINVILSELVHVHDVIASYTHHPWFGVQIAQYNPNRTKSDIRARFGRLVRSLEETQKTADKLAEVCRISHPNTLSEIDRLITLAALVARTPRPPADWFSPDAPARLLEEAKHHQSRFNDYHRRRDALLEAYEPTIFDLPPAELAELVLRLTERQKSLLDRVHPGGRSAADTLIGQREALQSNLAHICELLDRLAKSLPSLAAISGMEVPTSLAGITQLCKAAEWIAHDPRPLADWFSRTRLMELKAQAEEAGPYYTAYREEREQIKARYQDTFLSLDITDLYARFTGSYASLLRLIKPGYYHDLKQIRAELKASSKLSYDEATRDLKTARRTLERKQWIEARTVEHDRAFGRHYNGLDTRWPDILEAVETVRQLVDCLGENQIPDALRQLLMDSGSAIQSVREQRAVVQADLERLEQELSGLQRTLSLQGLPFTNKPLREADLGALKSWIAEMAACLTDFLAAWDMVFTCRSKNSALSERSVIEVVKDIQETRALVQIEVDVQTHAEELQAEFGYLFTGMNTRWENVLAALDWTGQVLDWFGALPPSTFVSVASSEDTAKQVTELLDSLHSSRWVVDEEAVFLHDLFPDHVRIEDKTFAEAPIASVRAWIQLRLDRLADLDRWMGFQNIRPKCEKEGIAAYLDLLCRDKPAGDQFKSAFYKRFWALWLDQIYRTDPVLVSFDSNRHEEQIARFRKLDSEQLQIAQHRLRELLWRGRPELDRGGQPTGEMQVLLKQARGQRLKPLRKLFSEIPELLLALKPCLLMSPLSVATFLDPRLIKFDTVIFDEASQIGSEDAIGAIMRGKQIIIVGDSKQLPPTRFFATGTVEEDDAEDEDDEATDVYESILEECSTIGLPSRMLRWHYRSRCEALIAFSNHHFYEDKLVTFPGPQVTDALSPDRCVEFIFVPDGVYIRGQGQNIGTNRAEARKIAELVFQHFQSQPKRSLGIIAFSERQQTAIDNELRRLRKEHPEHERFFSDQGEEPFFLKNLENVQGDERDTILFSVGYGRDQHGKLSMNFGPLNREGGERRLNVAVTRAKYQVKLVCSIQPHDIDLTRTEKKGPTLLKYYMEFAQNGPAALAREIQVSADPEFDSPFEEEVCRAIEERGLTVHRQIGCAGYRIDLAIVDNEHPGRYLLGIECDGATYHSAKTARDRDRLRQQVLEEMGWQGRILRIWSSDWIQNRKVQVERVIHALESARHVGENNLPASEADNDNSHTEEPETTGLEMGDEAGYVDALPDLPADMERDEARPPGVAPYRAFTGEHLGEPADFYALAGYKGQIADVLVSVVEQEGPIHILEATRRVGACWEMEKTSARLRKTVQIAAESAQKRGSIVIRGDFLWPSEMTKVMVRVPSDENSARNIEYVPLEEIVEACIICVHNAYAIPQDELITQAAHLLGYLRTGKKVRDRISEAIAYASKQGKVEVKDGVVKLRLTD